MAEGDGVLSDGTELHFTDVGGTLTKVKGLMNVNRPTLSVAKVENTDHDSGGTKTYLAGHGDVGELTATIKYEPGSPTDLLILEHLASKEKRPFKLVTVEEDGTTQDNTASIFLMTYVPDNAPLGQVRTATVTGQPSPLTQAATV
ncbi:hypothetical protein V5F89_12465 [Pelagerythrobacter marensis]|uniref:Phage tail protein n=1 Tax=Pelagerythrobacter marensis TaxID=543877 RepID=A0ABZ2D2T7_9SPHN